MIKHIYYKQVVDHLIELHSRSCSWFMSNKVERVPVNLQRVWHDIQLLKHIHTPQHTVKKTNLPRYPVSLHQAQLNNKYNNMFNNNYIINKLK